MNQLLERLREASVTELRRSPHAPLSENWSGLGKPDFKLSQREVREAGEAGLLSIKGDKAVIDAKILDRERHDKRSESAQKAAKTRREAPLSPSSLDMLHGMADGDWYAPNTWRDADDMKELYRKGCILCGDFKTPSGTKKYYKITGIGCDALVKAGLASYKEASK